MVWAAINQSSRSLPVYSVVKAVLGIANGLVVKVKLCHTGRRSEVGEKVSHHLNKGELAQSGQLVELKEEKQMEVSRVMKYYLENIKADVYLGRSLLRELKIRVEVFLGVDFELL